MTGRNYLDYLHDLLEACIDAQRFVEGLSFDDFRHNREKVYAVVRALEIIGEAARRIPFDIQEAYPNVPWREMVAMRNVVLHQYFGVDEAVIWQTVRMDLPPLETAIAQMTADLEGRTQDDRGT